MILRGPFGEIILPPKQLAQWHDFEMQKNPNPSSRQRPSPVPSRYSWFEPTYLKLKRAQCDNFNERIDQLSAQIQQFASCFAQPFPY